VEAMPFYNDLTEPTRKLITEEAIVEIIFLRAACCAGGNGDVSSVNGAQYSSDSLQKSGVSSSCVSILSDFIKWVRKLKMSEEEFAIMVVLILMSPDRGVTKDIDRCQLYRVQEIFRDILRQLIIENYPDSSTRRLGADLKQFVFYCWSSLGNLFLKTAFETGLSDQNKDRVS
jgi:hypothetical protein